MILVAGASALDYDYDYDLMIPKDAANDTDIDVYELLKLNNMTDLEEDIVDVDPTGFSMNEPEEDGEITEHPGLKNAEEILKGRSIAPEDEEDDSSSSLIWILIAVVLVAFALLGVFNHIIIPMFCLEKSAKKEKDEEKTILKMSDLEKDEKKKEEPIEEIKDNKRGSHNAAFEDVSLATDEKELERIVSIENENFERTVLKAVSAISPEMKDKLNTDNEEYTNTPRNSLMPNQETGKFEPEEDKLEEKEEQEENQASESAPKKTDLKEELTQTEKKLEKVSSTTSNDAKEGFRSRKKSTMSIEIEDGNITKFVEGSAGARISAIQETNQE
jgi:hypothetical protein